MMKEILQYELLYCDNHFGHTNIIKHDNRPFENASIMDEVMINNWNNVVKENDTVYILGDFSWHDEEGTISVLDKLAGQKVFQEIMM